jgi:hypothetical protein
MDILIDFEGAGSDAKPAEPPDSCQPRPQCPAAPEYWPNARAFGIVTGSVEQPWVRYLAKPVPVPQDLPDGITPRAVVRIAADCQEGGCRHWTDEACSLAKRVIQQFDPVTARVPPCSIRLICRWWDQEGPAACMRCPAIATDRGAAAPDDSNVSYL